MGRVQGRRPRRLVCRRSVAEGWGEFGVTDPGVWCAVRWGEFGVTALGVLVCIEPLSRVGLLVGIGLSCVCYPAFGFSQPEGLSFVPCPDHSGSSDALGEFANRYDRVESGSVVRDGVGIALL